MGFGGVTKSQFPGKGWSYMVDIGIIWKLAYDFLIPFCVTQHHICHHLATIGENVILGGVVGEQGLYILPVQKRFKEISENQLIS